MLVDRVLDSLERCKKGIDMLAKEKNADKVKIYKTLISALLKLVDVYASLLTDTYTKLEIRKQLSSNVDVLKLDRIKDLIETNENNFDKKNGLTKICVWCGKRKCVCGKEGRSPKPVPKNTPKKEKKDEK